MGHLDCAGVELVRCHLPLRCYVCALLCTHHTCCREVGFDVHPRHSICSHIRLANATRHVLEQSEDYDMDADVDRAESFEVFTLCKLGGRVGPNMRPLSSKPRTQPSASFITPGAQLTAPERARHMNHGRYTRFDDPSTTTP